MSIIVNTGSMMKCSFGQLPCVFNASPGTVLAKTPVGTIFDISITNIATFGMCTSLSNPMVASATAAALGALTPMPCIPLITNAWISSAPNVLIKNAPVLTNDAKTMCGYGGVISFMNVAQNTVMKK